MTVFLFCVCISYAGDVVSAEPNLAAPYMWCNCSRQPPVPDVPENAGRFVCATLIYCNIHPIHFYSQTRTQQVRQVRVSDMWRIIFWS